MRSLLQFIVLGVAMGSTYGMFAHGVVLIHRGAGVVNFAHGAIGSLSAYVTFVELRQGQGWPAAPAILCGVALAAAISLVFHLTVLRRLRNAAALVRVIATVALLALLQAIVVQHYGVALHPVKPFLPHAVHDIGGVKIQEDRVLLVLASVVMTTALWAATRWSRLGLAMQAGAENPRAVRTLGWSTERLAALTWAVGGGLGGLAAILVAPLPGLIPSTFTLVMTISGFGAALLGRFRSFPLTLLGGIAIGVGEALATRYQIEVRDLLGAEQLTGLNRAPAFLAILLVLVMRGSALPSRAEVTERLPRLGTGAWRWPIVLLGATVCLAWLLADPGDPWVRAFYGSLAVGVMVLSIIVLTGLAGQISLAQWSLGGVGALITHRLAVEAGLPMEVAMLIGVVGVIPVGVIFALPALRTRGVQLAVVTLGLGYLMTEMVFHNRWFLGRVGGAGRLEPLQLFGVRVDALDHPRRWAVISLIGFGLAGFVVANLRRSPTGRKLVAVRSNERAAASLGVPVLAVKVYAFAVAAGLAGLGGVLLAFEQRSVTYGQFGTFSSIDGLGNAVFGGIGFVLGAVVQAASTLDGLGAEALDSWAGLGSWSQVVGAGLVLAVLVAAPDGLARHLVGSRGTTRKAPPVVVQASRGSTRVTPATLSLSGLSVRFGAVLAVDDVDLDVLPGEVVGLIGPNGAGKTTVIDAVTGFVTPTSGTIALDDRSVDGLSPAGRSRLGIARSFQSLELFEDMTVRENIEVGARRAPAWRWLSDLVRPEIPPMGPTAAGAIDEFGLVPDLDRYPGELPAGRRRLVAMARTVASGPSVVLLDEPAAGLDNVESRELSALIRRLADGYGLSVLLIEHDVGLVMSTCDRVVVLDFGRVIASGTPSEIRNHPAVIDAYLGAAH